jgi:carbon-monoxide dehydrogenase medium subunit
MLLPKFAYHDPSDAEEACSILAHYGPEAKALAGGTDILVNLKKRLIAPGHLVNLGRVASLGQMGTDASDLIIGATVTVSALAAAAEIEQSLPALGQGARGLGSPLVRNRATIGGNICSARPAADLPPSLIAYGASVMLKHAGGERRIPLADFFKGPGMTAMAPGELVAAVHVPHPPSNAGAAYLNLGVRSSQDCNIVNVAAYLEIGADDTIVRARIVMGSVGPVPLRAPSAEKLLKGEPPSETLFQKAGVAASGDATPILDFRGSAGYRRDMVAVLTRRTLTMALEQIHSR